MTTAPSLLQRVAAGELAAMPACIDEYSGLVWSLARRFCPDAAEAEDAVQEVFISLWKNAERFDSNKSSEVTFVAMIARRRLIDRLRRRGRSRESAAEPDTLDVMSSAGGPAPGDALAAADDARAALAALEELAPNQQRVLRLAIREGYTHEQIAEAMQMPLGTVKTNARRGLMRVRDILGQRHAAEVEQ